MKPLIVGEVARPDGVLTPRGPVAPTVNLDVLERYWRRGMPASAAGGLVEVNAAKLLAVKAKGVRRWSLREALFEEWGARRVAAVVRRPELCTGLTGWVLAFDPRVPAYYVLRRGDLAPVAVVEHGASLSGPLVAAVEERVGARLESPEKYLRACKAFDKVGPGPRVLLGLSLAALLGLSVEEAVGAALSGRSGRRVPRKRLALFTEHAWSFYGGRLMGEGWRKIDVHRFYGKLLL